MRSMLRSSQQGAAVTEFALTLAVLLPLVFYVTYISEAFSAGMKAQEAEIDAAWDLSAHTLHDYARADTARVYGRAISGAQHRVDERLKDLDSCGTSAVAGRRLPLADIRYGGVRCARRFNDTDALDNTHRAMLPFDAIPDYRRGSNSDPDVVLNNDRAASQYLHRDGFVACEARVQLSNHFDPESQSLEAGFHTLLPLLPAPRSVFTLCGNGPGLNGCARRPDEGGLLILTDDWALEDGSPHQLGARLGGPGSNPGYFTVGEAVYGGGLAVTMIKKVFDALQGPGSGHSLDHAETNAFKLEYEDRISRQRVVNAVDPDAIELRAHLSPYDDRPITRTVYDERANNTYLGKRDPAFNQP